MYYNGSPHIQKGTDRKLELVVIKQKELKKKKRCVNNDFFFETWKK